MVLLEAMSYGLPIISYDCKCGPKDLINNGLNGFLVPEGNIEELANTIMRLISNRDMMIEMGRNAKLSLSSMKGRLLCRNGLICLRSNLKVEFTNILNTYAYCFHSICFNK